MAERRDGGGRARAGWPSAPQGAARLGRRSSGCPTTKTPGWEFTDLAELTEADFALPDGADPDARERADAVLNPPEDAPRSSRSTAPSLSRGRRRPAATARPSPSSRRSPRPRELYPTWSASSSARSSRPTTPSSPATTRPGAAARFVYVPAGKRLERARPDRRRPRRRRRRDQLAHPDRARGGRRGRGLGAVARRPTSSDAASSTP